MYYWAMKWHVQAGLLSVTTRGQPRHCDRSRRSQRRRLARRCGGGLGVPDTWGAAEQWRRDPSAPRATCATQAIPRLLVADINLDGKPDVIVANPMIALIGVLLPIHGTFQPVVTYASGGYFADSVAVADINGDGKPDVVVSNCGGNTVNGCGVDFPGAVGVLLGNGDGTFKPAVTDYSGGTWLWSLAVADLNGDGRPDVVTSHYSPNIGVSGSVGVLLNNAPFCATPPVITLSATPTSLWPPNGRMMPVTVSGTITDSGCTVISAAYAVKDEYGEVQPSGPVTLGTGGAYSFTVLLQASRLRSDSDGRLYTITVSATNNAGKTGSQAGPVDVFYDQGH